MPPALRALGSLLAALLALGVVTCPHANAAPAASVDRRLYVATPGIRDYLEFGGHGILVFDIDHDYRFLRRIPGAGLSPTGKPLNVKGIAACAATRRLYVTTLEKLACYDLTRDQLLWERSVDGGCDRLALTPDGSRLLLPSLEKSFWTVLDASQGDAIQRFDGFKAAHNTIVSLDGERGYLADRSSSTLGVVDMKTLKPLPAVGPFGHFIRPFTINGRHTRVYVCVDDLLGFEVGDLTTGKPLRRVEVAGFSKGPVKRHSCPSHGVGLTPDERELWLCDAFNQRLHIFDLTIDPPKQAASLPVRDQPGWITFRIDSRHAWPSTGEVFDVATRQLVTRLTDETGAPVHSEKMVEIHFSENRPVAVGDQFGLGRVRHDP